MSDSGPCGDFTDRNSAATLSAAMTAMRSVPLTLPESRNAAHLAVEVADGFAQRALFAVAAGQAVRTGP